MQGSVRERTPQYDNQTEKNQATSWPPESYLESKQTKNKNSNTESVESIQDTQEVFEFKREKFDLLDPDYIAPKHQEVNYEEMLKNGLERRSALIKKRRRSRTPPKQEEEINTENQSRQFENGVHKYVLAFFVIYLFWIMFK